MSPAGAVIEETHPIDPTDRSDQTNQTDTPRSHRAKRLRRDLRAIAVDGAAFSVMVGIGETYLPAFVLWISQSEFAAGLVATLPMLLGSLLQLVSPAAVRWLRSHRRWVVLCAVVQALVFLPLVAGSLRGSLSIFMIFLVASVYWGTNLGGGAAWNAWVETLIPKSIRTRYFARRTRIAQAAALVGLLVGGAILQLGGHTEATGAAFACMFLAAGVCRAVSAAALWWQSERKAPKLVKDFGVWWNTTFDTQPADDRRALAGTPTAVSRRPRKKPPSSRTRRLLTYLLLMQAAVQISGPYFTAYMLKYLNQSYLEYVVLIAAAYLSKILVLPTLGTIAKKSGARRLLWLGAVGIVPLPALWLVSGDFVYLFVIQVFAGVVWGAHELAMLLLFFESIPRRERTRVLSLFNFGNSAAMAGGTLIGAAVLGWCGTQAQTYLALFAISAACRLLPLALLARVPRRVAVTLPLALRVLALRPSMGSMDRPILDTRSNRAAPSDSSIRNQVA